MKTHNPTIVFLMLVSLTVMEACQKDRHEDLNATKETLVHEPLSNEEFNKRHEMAITQFWTMAMH